MIMIEIEIEWSYYRMISQENRNTCVVQTKNIANIIPALICP